MRRSFFLAISIITLSACADATPEPTGIDTAIAPGEVVNNEPVQMTSEVRAYLPFDDELFSTTVDQLLYVLPVTSSDVIDELSIVLEGQTGELVDLQTIRSCMNDYTGDDIEGDETSDAFDKAKSRWAAVLDEDATVELSRRASQTFQGCVTSDRSGCYQSCEAYAAAASTIASLPHLNEKTDD